MKIRHNITYIATLRNYKGDRIFSPIRSCILIKCFDKERNSKTRKWDIWANSPEKVKSLDYHALSRLEKTALLSLRKKSRLSLPREHSKLSPKIITSKNNDLPQNFFSRVLSLSLQEWLESYLA